MRESTINSLTHCNYLSMRYNAIRANYTRNIIMHPVILEKDQQTGGLGIAKFLPHMQAHFMKPNALICYGDLVLSAAAGNLFLYLAIMAPAWSVLQLGWMILSALLIFRASIFLHEAYHVGDQLKHFELVYNLVHGFLHKLPSYCYSPHRYHHLPTSYGTRKDPEYEPLGSYPAFRTLVVMPWLLMLIMPIFSFVRWVVFPPLLPFIGAKARNFIYVYASTLVLNNGYQRDEPTAAERRQWYWQDFGCFVYSAVCAWMIVAGWLPWHAILIWAGVHYFAWVLNYYRVIISHRYLTDFEVSTHKQQVIDSGTLTFSWWNFWLYPVGLRYHALHHLLPQMPYHSMGKAHRWLMQNLPPDHPYRVTVSDTYFGALREFVARKF